MKMTPEHVKTQKAAARTALQKAVGEEKDIVPSGETILDKLSAEEVSEMLSFFKSEYDRVITIIYVRPLQSLVASQFQQWVKLGLRFFLLLRPNYKDRFQPYLKSKDIDKAIFVRFDRKNLIWGDIVKDFASRIGAITVPQAPQEANLSLLTEAVGSIFAFNKYIGWRLP